MARYKFQGRSAQGQSILGEIEASSIDSAAGLLMGRGITPVKINEVGLSGSYIEKIGKFLGAEKIKPQDLIMFCRQMYTISKAGIPLTRGLRGLAASIRHNHFCDVLNDCADRLEAGSGVSQAMRHHPAIFNHLFVNMISVGETSGNLDGVFRQIGFYLERDLQTLKRIRSAMRYPTFVFTTLIIALTVINVFVVPAFAEMFAKFDADLPMLTQVLIGFSYVFVNYGFYLMSIAIILAVICIKYVKTERGGLKWGEVKLKIPIVGDIVERALMARYARSFSLMLGAGVPINQALTLCAGAIGNPYLAQKIHGVRQGVLRGDSLLRTHLNASMFTPLVLQMIAVGEESGQIESLLTEVAEFYEREVDYDLKTLTDRIEPILILVMAVFVIVLALGIFLPMWSMYDVQTGR